MGRAQSDTYSSLFTKSDNVNLDETFDRKSALVHVLSYTPHFDNCQNRLSHTETLFNETKPATNPHSATTTLSDTNIKRPL